MSRRRRPDSGPDYLTGREVEILTLIARGFSNEEICQQLYLSVNTIKGYIRSAYVKIGATSRTQSVIWSLKNGLDDTALEPVAPVAPASPVPPREDDTSRPRVRTAVHRPPARLRTVMAPH